MAAAAKPPFGLGPAREQFWNAPRNIQPAISIWASRVKPGIFFPPLQIDLKGARSCVVSGLWNLKCSYGWLSMDWFSLTPHILFTRMRISELRWSFLVISNSGYSGQFYRFPGVTDSWTVRPTCRYLRCNLLLAYLTCFKLKQKSFSPDSSDGHRRSFVSTWTAAHPGKVYIKMNRLQQQTNQTQHGSSHNQ